MDATASSDQGKSDPAPSDLGTSDPAPSDLGTSDPAPSDLGTSDPGPTDEGLAEERQQDGGGGRMWDEDAEVESLLPSPGRDGLAGIVGANIRYEAVRYELTQEDLAHAIGRSRAAVSARYTGKVAWTLAEVGRIAALMGLPPAELVTQAHRPTRYNSYW